MIIDWLFREMKNSLSVGLCFNWNAMIIDWLFREMKNSLSVGLVCLFYLVYCNAYTFFVGYCVYMSNLVRL